MDAEALKRTVSIVDVIERAGLHVTGNGAILTTVEHDSLKIYTTNNSYYWFSQGHGGSIFDWIMHSANVDFTEAARMLAAGDYRGTALPTPAAPKPVPALPQDLHLRYHQALDADARAWWATQGITADGIARFFLGVCDFHPYWRQTTYTIPVIEDGKLLNVRHRLSAPAKAGDKYRPEMAGIPASLFNADILTPELGGVVIVAGEKKAIVLWQYGIPAISATAGCGAWKPEWTTRLQFCRKVYLAYDPGESAHAWQVAAQIGERAYVVALPDKPDDFIVAQGEAAFRTYLRSAEPYADRTYWQRQLPAHRPLWGKLLE
jgi:DNA primase